MATKLKYKTADGLTVDEVRAMLIDGLLVRNVIVLHRNYISTANKRICSIGICGPLWTNHEALFFWYVPKLGKNYTAFFQEIDLETAFRIIDEVINGTYSGGQSEA